MSTGGPKVLFVDDDSDLCAVMKSAFERFGSPLCLTLGSLAEVEKLGKNIHDFDLAVLDINLGAGKPNGVEIFHWLEDHNYQGRVVFLTGHAHDDPRVLTAAAITGSLVLSKPIRGEDLRRIMQSGGH